jgi:hypothetical protein
METAIFYRVPFSIASIAMDGLLHIHRLVTITAHTSKRRDITTFAPSKILI